MDTPQYSFFQNTTKPSNKQTGRKIPTELQASDLDRKMVTYSTIRTRTLLTLQQLKQYGGLFIGVKDDNFAAERSTLRDLWSQLIGEDDLYLFWFLGEVKWRVFFCIAVDFNFFYPRVSFCWSSFLVYFSIDFQEERRNNVYWLWRLICLIH